MKTTVDIPDDLLIRAKKKAVDLRKPLRALIEDGLRMRLSAATESLGQQREVEWIIAEGGLPDGLELRDRVAMREWMGRNG